MRPERQQETGAPVAQTPPCSPCDHTVRPKKFNAEIADLVMSEGERKELIRAYIEDKIAEYRACKLCK